jgi:uncharacterized membrane protein YfbV (UPF0208 family)
VSPLSVLTGCLEAAFAAAHLIDSPQLQGSSCLGWVMVPEVQTVVTSYAERFMEQVGAQVWWEAVYCTDLVPARSEGVCLLLLLTVEAISSVQSIAPAWWRGVSSVC